MKISHTNNETKKIHSIIDMSIWSLHDGTNRRAALVTKQSDVRLCDALSFISTVTRDFIFSSYLDTRERQYYIAQMDVIWNYDA